MIGITRSLSGETRRRSYARLVTQIVIIFVIIVIIASPKLQKAKTVCVPCVDHVFCVSYD